MSYPTDMPLWRLEWNEGLSTHIPEIDAEHRHFIELVNDLNEAIMERMDLDVLRRCMQAILDDAAAHFAHEQVLFTEWRYPEAGEHAVKHAQIMRALNAIMARFERGGTEYDWIDAGLQIKNALIEHLLTEDMKYRDYYLASGGHSGAASHPSGGSPGPSS